MMARSTSMVALVLIGALGAGCSKDGSSHAADGTTTLTLEDLRRLQVRVPKDTKVSKNAVGIGVMLKGPKVSMTIGPEVDVDAADLEGAKKNARSYSPSDVEGEALKDGYILTYTNKGSMGTNYWLVGRRTIDGTAYTCGVSSPKEVHQKTAIAICKSLSEN